MADNTVSLWASDDVGGIQHARVKLEFGPDGTANYVSYSKPIPINIAIRGDSLVAVSASVAPARAIISASSSTTTTLVAGVSDKRIRVLDYVLMAHATASAQFGSSTTPITGTLILDKNSGVGGGFNHFGHFETGSGQPLTIISGDGSMAGHLTYVTVNYPATITTYNSGSGTETVPTGATQVVIEVWGSGGDGADGLANPGPGGGGGGGGGYCSRAAACVSGNTLSYSVGAAGGGNSTVSGTLTGGGSISMTANGGSDAVNDTPGNGGTASGGTTNSTGSIGTVGTSDPSIGGGGGDAAGGGGGGGGGGAGAGTNGTAPGGGGGGSGNSGAPGTGAVGRIRFSYT